jgi:G3E family GTPase
MSTENNKIRVILLSGFLGGGKTTLINQIIKSGLDLSGVVIMINEFGQLGIDGQLILHRGNEVIELTSGCICCTLVVDLKNRLLDIQQQYHARVVLIEASGVADPFGIQSIFHDPDIQYNFLIENIVTILDANTWRIRSVFGDLFVKQLQAADLILLNKIDLLELETLRTILQQLRHDYPDTRIMPTVQCRIDPAVLFEENQNNGSQTVVRVANERMTSIYIANGNGSKLNNPRFSSFVFQATEPLDKNAFVHFLERLPIEVFRIKGPVYFREQIQMLNHVGGQNTWTLWHGKPETCLAFVGWDMDIDSMTSVLKNCVSRRNHKTQN